LASALAIAWLPTLFLRAGWFDIVSLVTLFLRPSIREYVLQEVLPTMWLTVQKMVLAELWRKIWTVVLAPLPKPLFVPDYTAAATKEGGEDYVSLPPWMRRGLVQWNEMTDKFTQSLIRKSIEKNVYGTVEVVFDSVSNSMLEVSILYEESMLTEEESSSPSSLDEVIVDLFTVEDDDGSCDTEHSDP
jgi:hypothetical protein